MKFPLTIKAPKLHAGEKYIGIVTTPAGLQHVIRLPGDNDDASRKKQLAWAQSFYTGYQYDSHTGNHFRARAVRRVLIGAEHGE